MEPWQQTNSIAALEMAAQLRAADGWIVGYAAVSHAVMRDATGDYVFAPGCFRRSVFGPIVLNIDHLACQCHDPGRSNREPLEQLIDAHRVMAQRPDTLHVFEDACGLFFAARIPRDLGVGWKSRAPRSIHDIIESGDCQGVSVHYHDRQLREDTTGHRPFATIERCTLVEISLTILDAPRCRDTWCLRAGPQATATLRARLLSAGVDLSGVPHGA